jgi:flagellar basal body-associated protein FliL
MADKPSDPPLAEKEPTPAGAPAEPKSGGGGLMAWLPLIVTVVTMPALAYVMTAFVLAPKLQRAIASQTADATTPDKAAPAAAPAPAAEAKSGEDSSEGAAKAPAAVTNSGEPGKVPVQLGKVLVNISGSMGSRYLMANLTLVGGTPDFKDKVEANKDQLLDLANGTLAAKTINDLEKPNARSAIRSELLLAFNTALGEGSVKDIYITEFAIQ